MLHTQKYQPLHNYTWLFIISSTNAASNAACWHHLSPQTAQVEAVVYCLHLGSICARRKIGVHIRFSRQTDGTNGRCGYLDNSGEPPKVHCECEPTNWVRHFYSFIFANYVEYNNLPCPPFTVRSLPGETLYCTYVLFLSSLECLQAIVSQFINYKFSLAVSREQY